MGGEKETQPAIPSLVNHSCSGCCMLSTDCIYKLVSVYGTNIFIAHWCLACGCIIHSIIIMPVKCLYVVCCGCTYYSYNVPGFVAGTYVYMGNEAVIAYVHYI